MAILITNMLSRHTSLTRPQPDRMVIDAIVFRHSASLSSVQMCVCVCMCATNDLMLSAEG